MCVLVCVCAQATAVWQSRRFINERVAATAANRQSHPVGATVVASGQFLWARLLHRSGPCKQRAQLLCLPCVAGLEAVCAFHISASVVVLCFEVGFVCARARACVSVCCAQTAASSGQFAGASSSLTHGSNAVFAGSLVLSMRRRRVSGDAEMVRTAAHCSLLLCGVGVPSWLWMLIPLVV